MKKVKFVLAISLLWCFLFSACPSILCAQDNGEKESQRTIRGRVLDENRDPMAGVLVLVKGTTRGIATDEEGQYVLNLMQQDSILEFSFLGL